ncbi:MAG: gliding motility-associated C-terminal domain-containing protein [Brumimicrobium sp.]|nr:gliding motility-associated C-terminal domain-containing protein [Brumimicrobium sp.]
MNKQILTLLFLCFFSGNMFAQLQATFTKTINTECLGADCNWTGPSILINEIMIAPPGNIDGSLSGEAGVNPGKGEWIELYNPNICEPVDISCYYLGNATQGANIISPALLGGGFQLPQGTIVPPAGFCLVRGVNAASVPANLLVQNGGNVVEIVVPGTITSNGLCADDDGMSFTGPRLWFPNAGGWFAFYDNNGVPQDAISWGDQKGVGQAPCIPVNSPCNTGVTSLSNYNNIPADRKQMIYSGTISQDAQSIRRVPDGGSWVVNQKDAATYGTCNDICAQVGSSTCAGTATINVTGGTPPYTYAWNDSQSQTTQTATGLCGNTYQVTVTDNNGNTQVFSVVIEDLELDVSATSTDANCGMSDGQINVSVSNGASPYTYGIGEPTQSSNTFTGLASGAYTVTVKDDNGCVGTTNESIGSIGGPSVTAPSDITICLGDDVTLTATNPDGATISWDNGINDGVTFTPTTAGVTIYTVTATLGGCDAFDQTTVTVIANPDPTFDADILEGCKALKVTFSNTSGITGGTCLWDFGDGTTSTDCGTVIHTYQDAGDYTVTLSINVGNCQGTTTKTNYIHVIDGPTAAFTANPTVTHLPNTEVNFTNNSSNATNYAWEFGDGTNGSTDENPTHFFPSDDAGEYTVTLYASDANCTDSAKVKITIKYPGVEFEVPNVFTPNGDGNNDEFHFVYAKNIKSLELVIVNRWGNTVFESDEVVFSWNGKVKNSGADCSEGIYFYSIKVTDYEDVVHEENGFIHLTRGK